MFNPSPHQLKKLQTLAKVLDNGDLALLTELDALESRLEGIEGQLPALREARDGDTGERGEKGDKGDRGEMGAVGISGRDGKDSTTPGPQGPKGESGASVVGATGKDGNHGNHGKDGADGFVDVATVGYLEEEIKKIDKKYGGYGRVIRELRAGTNVTIDNSSLEYPIINATGGGGGGGGVPYVGATADVDLGDFNLFTNNLTSKGVLILGDLVDSVRINRVGPNIYCFDGINTGVLSPSANLDFSNVTLARTYNFPNKSGTFALLDDISSHTHLLAAGATDVTVTATNLNILDDGVNTALHFHDADRARGSHTGTQLAATISDFASTVQATVLTGLSLISVTVIAATDTVLVALGSLQAQITALTTSSNSKVQSVSAGTNTTVTGTATAPIVNAPTMTATVGGVVPTPPNNTTTFLRGDGTFATPAPVATITTQDESVSLSSTVTTLNFVGGGVTASGVGASTTITIPGTVYVAPELNQNNNTVTTNQTILAGYNAIIVRRYLISSGVRLLIGSGGRLRIL